MATRANDHGFEHLSDILQRVKDSAPEDITSARQLEAFTQRLHKSGILYSEAVREFKKHFILTVLEANAGNQCRAARELGMHRNTLSRTIDELKIDLRSMRCGRRKPNGRA